MPGQYFIQDPAADEAFLATALNRLGNTIDLVSGENSVYGWFARNQGIVPVPGGHTVVQPLFIRESGVPTWFDGLDLVSKDFDPGMTAAEYTWAWVSHPWRMEYTTKWKNSGPARVMSVPEQRMRSARTTLRNDYARKIVNGLGGKEPLGLLKIIEAAAVGSQAETVGGVDKSDPNNLWWNNQYREITNGQAFGDDLSGVAGLHLARGVFLTTQLFLDCKVGTSTPSAFFCTELAEQNFIRAMMITSQMRTMGKMDPNVDPTPHAISLFGKPIIAASEFPANTGLWITLNKDAGSPGLGNRTGPSEDGGLSARDLGGLYFGVHPEVNMTLDGPRVAGAQHVDWTFILSSCITIVENLAQQGRLGVSGNGTFDNWS